MITESSDNKGMLSLKWKVLIALSLLLLGIYSGFFWLGFETLRQQQQAQFDLMTQRFSNSLDHVLTSNMAMRNNLVETLTANNQDFKSIHTQIEEKWPLLQRQWELQSLTLIDANYRSVFSFGRLPASDIVEPLVKTALVQGSYSSNFSCKSTSFDSNCSLITALPIRINNGDRGFVIIETPITELILNLSQANLIEAAVLIREPNHIETSIDKWHLNLVAASDLDTAFDLLQLTSKKTTETQLVNHGVQLSAMERQFYIRAIATEKIHNNPRLLIILIDDITAQHDALRSRTRQIAVSAFIALILSEIFLLFVLWYPMERIKWQAKVLPLLADGDYHSVYAGPSYRNVRYRDELDILEDASMMLARNLERMGIEIRKRSSELEYIAHHDELTGLGNRRSLEVSLKEVLNQHTETQKGFALLLIDIDNFKRINDSLGHDVGDELLIEVGRRLRSITRSDDIVARLGGDEFVIIMRHIDNADAIVGPVQKILAALHEPVWLDTRQLHVSGSIGVTFAPTDGNDAATLMKNVRCQVFCADMQRRERSCGAIG